MKRRRSGSAKSVRAKAARDKPRAKSAAKPKHDAIAVLVAAQAEALGLTLDPAWHKSVAFNLRLILRHAALVDEFALPDDTEPAPIYHA